MRAAAICVAAELLIVGELDDNIIIDALSAGTGLEPAVIDALLGTYDVEPIQKIRAALLEDIEANTELTDGGAAGKSVWCLAEVWRTTSSLSGFGHEEIDARAFAYPIVKELRRRRLIQDDAQTA